MEVMIKYKVKNRIKVSTLPGQLRNSSDFLITCRDRRINDTFRLLSR